MMNHKQLVFLGVLFIGATFALDNGLGKTPQMGFNTWNHFGCNINQTLIRQSIDAMVSSGLAAAGYNYMNLDDCWQLTRNPKTGEIQPDPYTFPDGIKPLVDYAHSKGLLFGLYSDAGYKTCQGRPGSLGYEKIDAATYASWGVDYLKYDNCNTNGATPMVRYPPMRDALNATGSPIFFSMCEWGQFIPADWARPVANSWRTTLDISDTWTSMIDRVDWNEPYYAAAGPGGWNDPDMLEVGNGGMSNTEYTLHFSLWAAMKAPLLVGCDMADMSAATKTILMNTEVIAVNQDPLGVQANRVYIDVNNRDLETWGGRLSGGDHVVVLVNRDGMLTHNVTAQWSHLGLPAGSQYTARDLWAHADLGPFTDSFTAPVQSHGVVMLRLSPATAAATAE